MRGSAAVAFVGADCCFLLVKKLRGVMYVGGGAVGFSMHVSQTRWQRVLVFGCGCHCFWLRSVRGRADSGWLL
jgi:hypothetical protein